ncbi:MAG: ATP phosphoribosyltransferase regulatory subunit [Synergistaceae bacterium]|nr:ATP phosphoribosyltransferase regulatory subunit [Synergistaceae bacterium]
MNITPRGCASIGGELARCMEECRNKTMGMFASYGYNPFNPAEFQLLEGVMKNLPRRRRERIISLNSPFGDPCCMRADITLSALSYMALHYAPEEFPLRLCYADRVFAVPRPPRENLEDTQVGVELLGWEGIGSDVEVLALLMKALDSLGLTESVIVLGDSSIVPRLFANLPGNIADQLVERLQNGEYSAYCRIVNGADGITEADREILSKLPKLKGPDEILDGAEEIVGSRTPLHSLREICSSLEHLGYRDRVRIDLGFIRDLGYYRGPIFNVYASGDGGFLGGGGRYEGLLSDVRFSCQAVGFGLSLRELALARRPEARPARVMIWSGNLSPSESLRYASGLAERGISFEISWNPDDLESRNFAVSRGCRWWVNLRDDYAVDVSTGGRTRPDSVGGAL